MNLYAGRPDWAATDEVELFLAEDDGEALERGRYIAAHDVRDGHGSLTATVYTLGNLTELARVKAADCPQDWAANAVAGAELDHTEMFGTESLGHIYAHTVTTHTGESK